MASRKTSKSTSRKTASKPSRTSKKTARKEADKPALDQDAMTNITRLARLSISPAEAEKVTGRIASTLALIEQMSGVDTDGVEPLAHPLDMTQRLRDDEVSEADRRAELQALAPATEDGLYLVPKVID